MLTPKRVAVLLTAALVIAAVFASAAGARTVHWHSAGASTFGGPCQPSEHTGYRGDHLPTRWRSFAELGNGGALGGLPYMARIRVLNPATHRRLNIRKRDIGLGGSSVAGLLRSLDLYWRVTSYLDPAAGCSWWTGKVLWRRV